jgi:hypothetical protein
MNEGTATGGALLREELGAELEEMRAAGTLKTIQVVASPQGPEVTLRDRGPAIVLFEPHLELEAALADFLATEAALTYASCWNANHAVLDALAAARRGADRRRLARPRQGPRRRCGRLRRG